MTFHKLYIFYLINIIPFPGLQMHVRSPDNGNILGVGAAAIARYIHVAHRAVPNDGHSGLRQNMCSVHEGD